VFLDTNALILLARTPEADLSNLKTQQERNRLQLSVTSIQIDEASRGVKFSRDAPEHTTGKTKTRLVNEYTEKIGYALKSLRNKGLRLDVEPAKICVQGLERDGYGLEGGTQLGELYDELRDEIDRCEEKKGRPKDELNIAGDAVIAVTSIGHDFLVTADKCLAKSFKTVIERHKTDEHLLSFPVVVCCEHNEQMAECIEKVLA
jgi:hypothetical protein